jgi:serine phosphatase RsbU (regulator of sigma subunit)
MANPFDKLSAQSAKKIQQVILTTVEKFRGTAEQHDDVTMVVVKSLTTKKVKR